MGKDIFKFIFFNGAIIFFWWEKFVQIWNWFLLQNILIKAIMLIIVLFIVILILTKVRIDLLTIKKEIDKNKISKKLHQINKSEKDKINLLINNIPSTKVLKSIYNYAESYSKDWASDGTVKNVIFYIEYQKENIIKKRAQIYLVSCIRNEILTTYLPEYNSEGDIEEFNDLSEDLSNKIKTKKIFEFNKWNIAIEKVIESQSHNINKCDTLRIQISPNSEDLSISLYFEYDNRKSTQRFIFKEDIIKSQTNSKDIKI